jgi:hypothetical protein
VCCTGGDEEKAARRAVQLPHFVCGLRSALGLERRGRAVAIAGGCAGKGRSRFAVSMSKSVETEISTDASSEQMGALGGEAEYHNNRTRSLVWRWSAHDGWNFTDQNGVLHNIHSDASSSISLVP